MINSLEKLRSCRITTISSKSHMTVFRPNLRNSNLRTSLSLKRRRAKAKRKKWKTMKVQRTRLMISNRICRKKFASFTLI